jgi:hypothetical protein
MANKEPRRTLKRKLLEAECKAVARIVEAGKDGDVEALKWWLERRFPKRWGADRMRGKG